VTLPTVSLPVAALLSIATAVGGGWIAIEKTEATLAVRMDSSDKRMDQLQADMKGFTPNPEFALAFTEVKRELDEIRLDVKEIRRGVGR
jgi:hypothetical protein